MEKKIGLAEWSSYSSAIRQIVMLKLKNFLPLHILRTLYYSMIYPHLNYGLLVLGAQCSRIVKLQKCAIRTITRSKYNAYTVYPKKYADGFCFAVLCCGYTLTDFPISIRLTSLALTIAPVPAKQPWWIWINTSCEFIMNDCITTTKQSTTKSCAYFLGYTVHPRY